MRIINFEFLVLNYLLATDPHRITQTEMFRCLETINKGSGLKKGLMAQGLRRKANRLIELTKLIWLIGLKRKAKGVRRMA